MCCSSRTRGRGWQGLWDPHIGQHWWLSRVTCASAAAAARAPPHQSRAPYAAPSPAPRLSPACPPAPLALGLSPGSLSARCLEAIQAQCLVSMATPVEITLKRNETSSFSGWQAGGGELGWGRLGELSSRGLWSRRGSTWGPSAGEGPSRAGGMQRRLPLWHPVLATLGHMVLACMHAVPGVQHPDPVG